MYLLKLKSGLNLESEEVEIEGKGCEALYSWWCRNGFEDRARSDPDWRRLGGAAGPPYRCRRPSRRLGESERVSI